MAGAMQISSDAVIQEARKRAGLSDFGDESFREALEALLESLREQSGLFSEMGKMMLFEQIVGSLQKRLQIQDFLLRHPAAMDEKISRPIFITGLYRSGTTKLLNLICADPNLQHLKNWQTVYPVPLAETQSGQPDPRIEKAQSFLDFLRTKAPHAAEAHPLTALDPSEEVALMFPSFRVMDAMQLNTRFATWLAQHDNGPMYRDLHRALKVLQFQYKWPNVAEQRYCLKAPVHLGNLDLLMREFPDAKVLMTHRDPFLAIHSFTMMRESLRGLYCDSVDPLAMGTEILGQASRALERAVACRKILPAGNVFDLSFDDIVNRLPQRLDEIYAFIDSPLTADVRKVLSQEDEHGGEHKSRATKKDPAIYGLTRERVYAAIPNYLAFATEHVGEIIPRQAGT